MTFKRTKWFSPFLFALVAGSSSCSSNAPAEEEAPPEESPPEESPPTPEAGVQTPVEAGLPDVPYTPGALPNATSLATLQVLPSDRGAAMLAALRGAKKTLYLSVYMLTDSTTISALIDRKKAGVDVRVVLNKSFPDGNNVNESAFGKLQAAGVGVKWSLDVFRFSHIKAFVVDSKQAWIMTMNLTDTSMSENREMLVVVADPDDVRQAEGILVADYNNTSPPTAGKLVVSPTNSRTVLTQLVAAATKTIDIEAETLSDYDFAKSLVQAKQRGVSIRLVIGDNSPSDAQSAAVDSLKQVGVVPVFLRTPNIHNKAMVVDGKVALVGSMNFTAISISSNRELGVLLSTPSEVKKVSDTISQDYGKGTKL